MFTKMLKWVAAGAVAVGIFSSNASASLIVELKAVAGSGYTVTDAGKTVTLTGGAVPITMQLVGSVGTNAGNDVIYLTRGDIVTSATGGGAVTGGGTSFAMSSAFSFNTFSNGTNQLLSSASGEVIADDGVGDTGLTGNATLVSGDTHTWASNSGTGVWIEANQNATSPVGGNQVLGTLTLTPTGTGTGSTSVQWYFRSGTGNHTFAEAGTTVTSKTFGTNILGGAPVVIAVPEPASLGLLGVGMLGLLVRRRRA